MSETLNLYSGRPLFRRTTIVVLWDTWVWLSYATCKLTFRLVASYCYYEADLLFVVVVDLLRLCSAIFPVAISWLTE